MKTGRPPSLVGYVTAAMTAASTARPHLPLHLTAAPAGSSTRHTLEPSSGSSGGRAGQACGRFTEPQCGTVGGAAGGSWRRFWVRLGMGCLRPQQV